MKAKTDQGSGIVGHTTGDSIAVNHSDLSRDKVDNTITSAINSANIEVS